MRYESYQALKSEILEQHEELSARAFYMGETPPPPAAVGLAKGERQDDFKLAIRTDNPEAAAELVERAAGEADVRILQVEARGTNPAWFQAERRPLEAGAEVQPKGQPWVGTLGAIVRHLETGKIGILSNAHVLTDMGNLGRGTPILQPYAGEEIGSVWEDVPVSAAGGNIADAAWAILRRGITVARNFTAAYGHILAGTHELTPDDLGRPTGKAGRTTGVTHGAVTAIDIDSLPVGYGGGRTYRFNDQIEFSGGLQSDFSAGGDSGSLIVSTAEGRPVALLFAGGRDERGEDVTFGNPLQVVLDRLGLELI